MSLTNVLKKLDVIANNPSTKEKVALLKDFLKDKNFLLTTKYALSEDKKFKIKKLPKFKQSGLLFKSDNESIFSALRQLSKQPGVSNEEKENLASLASIDFDTYEVVRRIVNKDLKCGASAKLVNKARPGTINIVPYMRCSTEKKISNIDYPAIVQEKANGMFANVMINNKGQIKIITRNGKTVYQLKKLKQAIRKSFKAPKFHGSVFNGELLVKVNGEILDRETGNGILNSCIQNSANQKFADCVVFKTWDYIPLKKFYNGYDETPYFTRLEKTKEFIKCVQVGNKDIVSLIPTKEVKSIGEAKSFYKKMREMGLEGAVLKNIYGEWKDHTSPDQIKLKNTSEAELKVVSWNSGKKHSKYENMLGALGCESSCGKLNVAVGSGFSDEDRKKEPNYWLGKIITVEFESIIKDKRKRVWSLFLPRYVEKRVDRDIADTLEEIKKR